MASLRYSITCVCGQVREGKRPSRLATLTCSKCGADLLVFPTSPLVKLSLAVTPTVSSTARWPWWKPIIAGLSTLLLVLILILWWILSGPPLADVKRPPEEVEAEIRRQIRKGAFLEAKTRLESWIGSLRGEKRFQMAQLLRQVALAHDLIDEPMPDFLKRARDFKDDRAWREEFQKRYFNRTILFDAPLKVDEEGNLHLEQEFPPIDGPILLELNEVHLLKLLATRHAQPWFFGLRLQDAQRTEQGGWRLFFEPKGGVLITDIEVVQSLPVKLTDELRARIAAQAIRSESLRGR